MKTPTLQQWANHLRAIGRTVFPDQHPAPETFSDELGHRRPVDPWVLAWRRTLAGLPVPTNAPPASGDLDVRLWRSLTDPTCLLENDAENLLDAEGPILPRSDGLALEVWTEIELASVHALWWHARSRESSALRVRVDRAARWHLQHVQPDNATNHPWALHVFLLLHEQEPDLGARLYAETLLSNCQVMLGQPDRFSALLLLDAADAIDQHEPG